MNDGDLIPGWKPPPRPALRVGYRDLVAAGADDVAHSAGRARSLQWSPSDLTAYVWKRGPAWRRIRRLLRRGHLKPIARIAWTKSEPAGRMFASPITIMHPEAPHV